MSDLHRVAALASHGMKIQLLRAAAAAACLSGALTGGLPSATAQGEPVLGSPLDGSSMGFGDARPAVISPGSMCGNLVHDIVWDGWGGPVARGSGVWCQSAGEVGEPVRPVRLTASDLGPCHGTVAYRSLQYGDAEPMSVCYG